MANTNALTRVVMMGFVLAALFAVSASASEPAAEAVEESGAPAVGFDHEMGGLHQYSGDLTRCPADVNWSEEFSYPSLRGQVLATTVYNGELIASGYFTYADVAYAPGLARWDGSEWHGMSTEMGFDGVAGSIKTMTVYDGELIVGGAFTSIDGITAYRVAAWDGSSWRALGSGMDGTVYALAVYNGDLVAGGRFDLADGAPARRLARWDGSSWSSVWMPVDSTYSGSSMSSVRALAEYNGDLYVGGYYNSFVGEGITMWDGLTWSGVGLGLDSDSSDDFTVRTLGLHDGRLIAAGSFLLADGIRARRVAAWDGFNWTPLGDGFGSQPNDLTMFDGTLMAVGYFGGYYVGLAGEGDPSMIAAWDGVSWTEVGGGIDGLWVDAVTVYNDELIVGGTFWSAGDVNACIVRWNGSDWNPLSSVPGEGVDQEIFTLTAYDGKLIAGGWFEVAGDDRASRLAVWDGNSWSTLGDGCGYPWPKVGMVFEGDLILGGSSFQIPGDETQCNVVRWDGSSFSSMVGGVGMARVEALAIHEGQLIAAGMGWSPSEEDHRGGVYAWDGSGWSQLGVGMAGSHGYGAPGWAFYVEALAVYNGELIAAGSFAYAGGVEARCIASWNGSSWSEFGGGLGQYGTVHGMMVYDDRLIVAGSFTEIGGVTSVYIAAWDGVAWSPLETGMDQPVTELLVWGDHLVVGGDFTTAGGVYANKIAAWDGACWSRLGSGVNHVVEALAEYNGSLFAGGWFVSAGGKASGGIARWDGVIEGCLCCVDRRGNIDYDPDGTVDISDLVYLVDFMFASGPEPPCMQEADVDGSGGEAVDIADLTYFVEYVFSGGPEPALCP